MNRALGGAIPLFIFILTAAPALAYQDFTVNPSFEGNLASGYMSYVLQGLGGSGGYTWIDNVTCSTFGRCLDIYSSNAAFFRLVPTSTSSLPFTNYVNAQGIGVPLPTVTIPANKELIVSMEFQTTVPVNALARVISNPTSTAILNDANYTNYTTLGIDSDSLGNSNFHFVIIVPASTQQRTVSIVLDIYNPNPSILETVTVRYKRVHVFTLDENEYRNDWTGVLATETARYCGASTVAYDNTYSQAKMNYDMNGAENTAFILTQTQELFDCSVFKLGDKVIVRRGTSSPTYNVTDNRVPELQAYRDMYLFSLYSVGSPNYKYVCSRALMTAFPNPSQANLTLLFADGGASDGCGSPQSGSPVGKMIFNSPSTPDYRFMGSYPDGYAIEGNNVSDTQFNTSIFNRVIDLTSYNQTTGSTAGSNRWHLYVYPNLFTSALYPFFSGTTTVNCEIRYICDPIDNRQYAIGSDCNVMAGTNISCGNCGCNVNLTSCQIQNFYGTVCDSSDPTNRAWTTSFQDCSASTSGFCQNNTVCFQYSSTARGDNKNTIACNDIASNQTAYYINEYGNQTTSITNVTGSGTTTVPTVTSNPIGYVSSWVGRLFGKSPDASGNISTADKESSDNIFGIILALGVAGGLGYLGRKSKNVGIVIVLGFTGGLFIAALAFATVLLWALAVIVAIIAALGLSGALNKVIGG